MTQEMRFLDDAALKVLSDTDALKFRAIRSLHDAVCNVILIKVMVSLHHKVSLFGILYMGILSVTLTI